MQHRTRAAGVLTLALTLAAAAACTDDPKDGGDAAEGQVFDEDRLIEMIDESARLEYELEAAELRVMQRCLEDNGFTVHDQLYFGSSPEPEETETLVDYYPFEGWLPEVEEAAQYGFGIWANSDEGSGTDEAEAYREDQGIMDDGDLMSGASPEGGDLFDNSAFEALSPQEQYDWYVAFWGEEAAAQEMGHLVGEDSSSDSASVDYGELDLEDEPEYVQPEPGGCQREMIDALYDGDMQVVEEGGEEYTSVVWQYRPVNPTWTLESMQEFKTLYREEIAEAEVKLVDCLAERGHPDWEFDEEGGLPVTDYFYELYTGESDVDGYPALPDDAPADYEGQKEFELAFATDLAECGDETGFREAATTAFEENQEEYYLSVETATYAWQDEVRGILTKAQEVLGG